METEDVREIRSIFERAEQESDPELKLSLLEEALDAFNCLAAESEFDSTELATAINLHHSYLRLIITQITEFRKLERSVFYGYMKVLYFDSGHYTREAISRDPRVHEAFKEFWVRYEGFLRA